MITRVGAALVAVPVGLLRVARWCYGQWTSRLVATSVTFHSPGFYVDQIKPGDFLPVSKTKQRYVRIERVMTTNKMLTMEYTRHRHGGLVIYNEHGEAIG